MLARDKGPLLCGKEGMYTHLGPAPLVQAILEVMEVVVLRDEGGRCLANQELLKH